MMEIITKEGSHLKEVGEMFFKKISIEKVQARKKVNDDNRGEIIKSKPIIVTEEDTLRCPIPDLIIKNMTEGLRLSFMNEKGFSNLFGQGYEKSIKEIFYKKNNIKEITIREGDANKKRERRGAPSIDWLIEDSTGVLLIESKTYYPTLKIKQGTSGVDSAIEEIEKKHIKAVTQVYKSINSFLQGGYREISTDKEMMPLIVYLGDRYINILKNNKEIRDAMKKKIKEELEKRKISIKFLEKYPIHYCSIRDFEDILGIMQKTDIKKINKEMKNKKNEKYDIAGYTQFNYPEIKKIKTRDETIEKIINIGKERIKKITPNN